VALLLLAHILGGLMLAQCCLCLCQEGGVEFKRRTASDRRLGGIQAAFFEFLSAPARARLIPSRLHSSRFRYSQ
jgi:hypothetical protein